MSTGLGRLRGAGYSSPESGQEGVLVIKLGLEALLQVSRTTLHCGDPIALRTA